MTVGEISREATVFRHGLVPPTLIPSLRAKGATANVLSYFIDAQGRLVDHEVNDRVMAIDLGMVGAIPNVVLAAGGRHKIAAIRAALNAFETNVLITDSETAEALAASG